MTKNPLINSLSALGYIALVSVVMNYVSQTQSNKPDTVFAPIAFLSLFTLSAALMGYFFLYQPAQLFLDGKKKTAVDLFVKTVGIFGLFTSIFFALLLTGLI